MCNFSAPIEFKVMLLFYIQKVKSLDPVSTGECQVEYTHTHTHTCMHENANLHFVILSINMC